MTPIQEVAKRAGVSVATVSRVLNNNPYVKEDTREKVAKVIKELNYSPNLSGRILRRNETKIILVLLNTISNPFFSKAVTGIRHVADKMGYLLMICNTDSDPKKEIEFLNLLKFKQADGAIIITQETDVKKLEEIGASYPIVQCFEYHDSDSLSYVSIDNEKAAYEAVSYLISIGHKRIGFVGCNAPYSSARQREQGYIQALNDAGIELDENLIIRGDYGFKSGYDCAGKLLEQAQTPTAIFAISDMQAIGVIKALKNKGIRVPEDISVAGFDNISFSGIYDPGLTTISQPAYKIGSRAMSLLIDRIKEETSKPQHILLKHHLIIRESTIPQT
jgi:LacI family repressor for deo operon, udp, cdd, tsx, nupC, and nupG